MWVVQSLYGKYKSSLKYVVQLPEPSVTGAAGSFAEDEDEDKAARGSDSEDDGKKDGKSSGNVYFGGAGGTMVPKVDALGVYGKSVIESNTKEQRETGTYRVVVLSRLGSEARNEVP